MNKERTHYFTENREDPYVKGGLQAPCGTLMLKPGEGGQLLMTSAAPATGDWNEVTCFDCLGHLKDRMDAGEPGPNERKAGERGFQELLKTLRKYPLPGMCVTALRRLINTLEESESGRSLTVADALEDEEVRLSWQRPSESVGEGVDDTTRLLVNLMHDGLAKATLKDRQLVGDLQPENAPPVPPPPLRRTPTVVVSLKEGCLEILETDDEVAIDIMLKDRPARRVVWPL